MRKISCWLLRFSTFVVHLFHLLFHFVSFPFHSCFIMRLAFYIHCSFTLSEAAHLTPSSCSTMMIPSHFLPLYSINTRDVVDCKLTYSWEYILLYLLSNLTSWQQLYLSSLIQTQLLTVETSTVSWSPNTDSLTWPTFRSKKLVQPKHHGNPLRRLFLDLFQVSSFKSNISFAHIYCVQELQAFCKFDFLVATSEPSLWQMPQQEIMHGTMHEHTKVGQNCVYLVLSDAHKCE